MDSVYLRRKRKVVVSPPDASQEKRSVAEIATFQKNLEVLGFCLSEVLADEVRSLSADGFATLYFRTQDQLRLMTGAHQTLRPMYPDFPRQVMEMSEAELYLNALYHYHTLELPDRAASARPKLLGRTPLTVIHLGNSDERNQIFTDLCAGKTSLSTADKEDITIFVKAFGDEIEALIPTEIAMRETVAVLGAELLEHTSLGSAFVETHANSATDILRLAVAMSGGDVSLFEPCKFGKFSRLMRKFLLAKIDSSADTISDMLRWKGRWIRLGERLHPGEHSKRFPSAAKAFAAIRNGLPHETENSRIEALFEQKNIQGLIEILRRAPGIFARRLDHLLRVANDHRQVLREFEKIAANVATPILLRMVSHFRFREKQRDIDRTQGDEISIASPPKETKDADRFGTGLVDALKSMINVKRPDPRPTITKVKIPNELIRVFFPKGEVAKVFARAEPLPDLPEGIADRAATICEQAYERVVSQRSGLGKCWIDPGLKQFRIPTAQRSAAKALRTLPRGSRLPIPDATTLRFFIWWMNGDNRTDLDLSAVLYDSRFRYVDALTYYNLKNFGGHHSGDITDAPDGAAEFIDLDIAKTRAERVRFVVMVVNSFTQQPYCDLPECFAGWMARQHPNSGEIFEAKTVVDKVDLASDTSISIPVIFDLETHEAIWCDLALKSTPSFNNVENNLSGLSLMVRSMIALKTPNLFDLFSLHAKARGEIVDDWQEADTVFSREDGDVTPFDLEKIAADYL